LTTKSVAEMVLTRHPLFEIGDEFAELIFFGLDHALHSISDGGTLVPFLLHEEQAKRGRRTLARFDADLYEESVSRARSAAASLPTSVIACVLAYDGFVTVEGTKYSAILMEGAERDNRQGFAFAQRYIPAAPARPFHRIGNMAFVGECDSLFGAPPR